MDLTIIIILSSKSYKKNVKNSLGENTEKYITFTVTIEKEVRRTDKNGEEITKKYISLLIAQDLWQAHYQILSIIFLKEFI